MASALNWFEIPATDIERARTFYSTVLGIDMISIPGIGDGFTMYAFTMEQDSVGGAIIQGEGHKPSTEGTIVYLNAGDSLSGPVERIEAAGGKVLTPSMSIGENGFIAFLMDTEGNRVGLHSMKE